MKEFHSVYLENKIDVEVGQFRNTYYVGDSGFTSLETAQNWIEKKLKLEKQWNSGEMQICGFYSQNFIQLSMSAKDLPKFLHLLHPNNMIYYITNIGSKDGKIVFLTISTIKNKEETEKVLGEIFKKVKGDSHEVLK